MDNIHGRPKTVPYLIPSHSHSHAHHKFSPGNHGTRSETGAGPAARKLGVSRQWLGLQRSISYRGSEDDDGVGAREAVKKGVWIEGRKSVSAVETNSRSVAAFLQVRILTADMPRDMQVHACRCARQTYDCLEKFSSKLMASNIKKEFDRVYGPAWHCIVGSSFGSFVTHSTGCFIYFSMEKLLVLLFKTKVQRVTV